MPEMRHDVIDELLHQFRRHVLDFATAANLGHHEIAKLVAHDLRLVRGAQMLEEPAVIERILKHLGREAVPVDPAHPSRAPPRSDRLI
jgi:hypothetical protein